jgi:hypothetical protein
MQGAHTAIRGLLLLETFLRISRGIFPEEGFQGKGEAEKKHDNTCGNYDLNHCLYHI